MISKVGQIMLYVNDQDESVKFWTEQLGFAVIAEEDNQQGFRWIEIAQGIGRLLIMGTSLQQRRNSPVFSVEQG